MLALPKGETGKSADISVHLVSPKAGLEPGELDCTLWGFKQGTHSHSSEQQEGEQSRLSRCGCGRDGEHWSAEPMAARRLLGAFPTLLWAHLKELLCRRAALCPFTRPRSYWFTKEGATRKRWHRLSPSQTPPAGASPRRLQPAGQLCTCGQPRHMWLFIQQIANCPALSSQ